jgi:DNA-directed RNA polymerase subunit M/transcription elongation factor TFIIS
VAIGLICNRCGARLKVPEKFAGEYGECPQCHSRIKIPSLPPETEVHFCDNCESTVYATDTAHIHSGKLLCQKCYEEATGAKPRKATEPALSQLDVNVPDMVVLRGKEERKTARLLRDVAAKEEFRRETRVFAKHRGELSCEKELGELLVSKRVITAEQFANAREVQKGSGLSLITVLVNLRLSDEVKIASVLAHETGLLFSDAGVLQVDKAVRGILPPEVIATYEAIPLSRSANSVVVAMVNPLDKEAIREIENLTKLKVTPLVCTKTAFRTTLSHRDVQT